MTGETHLTAIGCALVGVGLLLCLACAPRFSPTKTSTTASAFSPVQMRSASVLDASGRFFIHDDPWGHGASGLVVVDLERVAELGSFVLHESPRSDGFHLALALAPSAGMVASLRGREDEILVWEPRNREILSRIRTEVGEEILGFTFSPDERSLVLVTSRGLERRALPDGRVLSEWTIPGVRAVTFMPGSDDEMLIAVDRTRGAFFAMLDSRHVRYRRLRIPGLRGVESMSISPDARWLAVSAWGEDAANPLQVWDLVGRRRFDAVGARKAVNAVAFSEDGQILAASLGAPCIHPGRTHLMAWDLRTGHVVADVPLAQANSLRIRGREVLAGVIDNVVRLDLSTGRTTMVLPTGCGKRSCSPTVCG